MCVCVCVCESVCVCECECAVSLQAGEGLPAEERETGHGEHGATGTACNHTCFNDLSPVLPVSITTAKFVFNTYHFATETAAIKYRLAENSEISRTGKYMHPSV